MKKVSIITPIYNAAKTLQRTLSSFLIQDYSCIELVFINDCSRDSSALILEDFVGIYASKFEIKVSNHPHNMGVAAARNTGLENATGDFIYFVDADDSLEPDAISKMVAAAERHQADIVGCNWYLSFSRNKRLMKQAHFANPEEAIKWILVGRLRWNLWLFMVRRSLYENNNIRFVPGRNMGEDLLVTIQLLLAAQNVYLIPDALYNYEQSNELSLTKQYTAKHVQEVSYNVRAVEAILASSRFRKPLMHWIPFLKLTIKLPLLIGNKIEQYKKWLTWFPEVNDLAGRNRFLPMRIRFLEIAAQQKQFWILKGYYYLLVRLVYGKIFK